MCRELEAMVRLLDRAQLHSLLACGTSTVSTFSVWAYTKCLCVFVCLYYCPCSQLVKNCRTGKGDEALSFWFLLQWFLGDATNLLGAILSHQLGTQVKLFVSPAWAEKEDVVAFITRIYDGRLSVL